MTNETNLYPDIFIKRPYICSVKYLFLLLLLFFTQILQGNIGYTRINYYQMLLKISIRKKNEIICLSSLSAFFSNIIQNSIQMTNETNLYFKYLYLYNISILIKKYLSLLIIYEYSPVSIYKIIVYRISVWHMYFKYFLLKV